MGRCKDCAHWGGPVDRRDATSVRSCQRLSMLNRAESESDLVKLDVCSDHEHYGVAVVTRAEFGCVLFEPRGAN